MSERGADWRAGDEFARDAGDAGTTQDPAELRADIRETRERLGDTLEEIGARLNPRHIGEQVKENIRDATIGRVGHMARDAADRVNEVRYTMMDTIRDNPIPAAMVGIGLGWLFMNARRQGGTSAAYGTAPYAGSARYYDERGGYAGASGAGAASYGAGGYTGYDESSDEHGLAGRARERVGEAVHGAREGAGHVAHRAADAAHGVADRARGLASTVADTSRHQARRAEDLLQEQPLAVGAFALAIGLAAGFALPVTDREVEMMGDARDRIVDRVKEAAQETTGKVQAVAERVVSETQTTVKETAKEAAREQGLTGSQGSQGSTGAGMQGGASLGGLAQGGTATGGASTSGSTTTGGSGLYGA